MKTRVLVFGLSDVVGGIETYIRNIFYSIDRKKYIFDYFMVGNNKACFTEEFSALYDDGEQHFFYCPNMKKNFLEANKWLKEFYETHHYDIIYMNVTTAARLMYCKYAVIKQHVPLITHNHCGNAVTWKASLNNNLFRPYTTKLSKVRLACSKEAYRYGFIGDCKDEQIIKNGIDLERFSYNSGYRDELRDKYHISDDKIVIGHIGRFAREKNQRFFIELSCLLGDKYVFVCAGEGALKRELMNKIQENGLSERFRFLPFSNATEKYYSMMDIFAMPSLYEGLPLVAVEAQASGLPCVFSDTISRSADICGHSNFCSLDDASLWSDIIKQQPIIRYDNKKTLTENGYDVVMTAKKIEGIFDRVRSAR